MMWVSLPEEYTLDEFSAAIPWLMRDLAANEIQSIARITLQLSLKDREGPTVMRWPNGCPVSYLRWYNPIFRMRTPRGYFDSPFPKRSSLNELACAPGEWRGRDLAYLRSKWDLSNEELAALLGVTTPRALTLMATPASKPRTEERVRLNILLDLNRRLVDLLHPISVAQWLRSEATMNGFEGRSPLEQLVTFGVAALDRLHRTLNHTIYDEEPSARPELLRSGYDWFLDKSHLRGDCGR